jgi:putative hydrolase of the HAD superfamily
VRAVGGPAVADHELDDAVEALYRTYLSDVSVKPGAYEALEALRRMACRMGVVSNTAYAPFLSWSLEAQGLRDFFEVVVTSAEVGIRKPRHEIFDAALEAMRLPAAQAAYVGNDYLKDVMGARLAGMRAVWVPGATAIDYREHTTIHPDAVIDRLDALPKIVSSLTDRMVRCEGRV